MDMHNGNAGTNGLRLGEAATRVKQDLGDLGRALAGGRKDLIGTIATFVKTQPVLAFGMAFGIGYLLGGGLFSRTTSRMLRVGMRIGGAKMLRDIVAALGETETLEDNPATIGA